MSDEARLCERAGCLNEAKVLIRLIDPTGEMSWPSCWPCADEFQAWAEQEVRKQDGQMAGWFKPHPVPWHK